MFSPKRTANRGPNAVSIVRLRGCWSTIRIRLDHFATLKTLLSIEIYLFAQCTMGNEHTFVDISAYLRPSLESCMIGLLE